MFIDIVIYIMLAAGILGGVVNFLLPSNEKEGKKVRDSVSCIVLGIGATLLVPLFLEIAQSKLLDNLYFLQSPNSTGGDLVLSQNKESNLRTNSGSTKDSTKCHAKTLKLPSSNDDFGQLPRNSPPTNAPKNYLLFAAYCLVAAAAGFRFIDSVINSVVKEKENAHLKSENQDLKKETEMRQANSQMSQKLADVDLRKQLLEEKAEELKTIVATNPDGMPTIELPLLPQLPPVIHPNDPQKGRFGGKPESNFRRLAAEVTTSAIPNFFHVKLWVESTDPVNHPMTSDVIFYIHDSFSPSVFTYKPNEFTQDGKAMEDDILSFGAFTVGVITDNGKTMLELDLAEQKEFPKSFRER